MTQRVAITGASGLIGGALSSFLTARGDEVAHLVRRAPRTTGEITWSPGSPLDPGELTGFDAVINLAGAGIADRRWNAEYRAEIRRSRIDGTRTLVRALAALDSPVRLVNASAVGIYGDDRGEELLTEESAPGSGFLADVVVAWEEQASQAATAGHSVTLARSGIVLSPGGGAMGKILPLAKWGLAGPLGEGRQYWPVISLVDEVAALAWLIDHPEVKGPVNVVGPEPIRQADLMRLLAEAFGRPSVLPAPARALRLALGGLAEGLLGSQRVVPAVLEAHGFEFAHRDVPAAIAWLKSEAG